MRQCVNNKCKGKRIKGRSYCHKCADAATARNRKRLRRDSGMAKPNVSGLIS